jgi:hypothetical protein
MDMGQRVAHAVAIKCLKAAREKLAKGWSKGWFAFDAAGVRCDSHDEKAVSFCMMGGITAGIKAAGLVLESGCIIQSVSVYVREEVEKTILALDIPGKHHLAGYNDHPDRTQEEVLAVIDTTIARLEKETHE